MLPRQFLLILDSEMRRFVAEAISFSLGKISLRFTPLQETGYDRSNEWGRGEAVASP